jgi:hypothetical protein
LLPSLPLPLPLPLLLLLLLLLLSLLAAQASASFRRGTMFMLCSSWGEGPQAG